MSTKVHELLFMIEVFLMKIIPTGKKFPVGKTVGVIDGCDNQLQVLLEEIAVENTFGVRRGTVFKPYG